MQPGKGLLDMGGLLMDLQDLLGCRVDVVTEKGLRVGFGESPEGSGPVMRNDIEWLQDILEAIERRQK